MATVSSWLINDISLKGVNTAVGANNTASSFGNTLAGPYTSYQAAYSALAATQAANPAAVCRLVRFDLNDGGGQNYCLLAPGF